MSSLDSKNPTREYLSKANYLISKKNSDKRLIRNFIAPNIPSSLKKDFKLKEGHRKDTLQDVLRILETLEKFDSP